MKKLMSLLIAFILVVTFPITTQSIANTERTCYSYRWKD